MTDDRELTAAEIEAVQREQFYADRDAVTAELYPRSPTCRRAIGTAV
ncbi:hypothetical protein [Actinomadura sp. 3N508]